MRVDKVCELLSTPWGYRSSFKLPVADLRFDVVVHMENVGGVEFALQLGQTLIVLAE